MTSSPFEHDYQGDRNTEPGLTVGILHSLTGTMAISEVGVKDATLMAIAEINASGGVLGQEVRPLVVDGASDPAEFARQARLLGERNIAHIFGCWTSSCRKAVLPVLGEFQQLLWYPVQYEGLESSVNVFYGGLCPNQQVVTALDWLLSQNYHKFYLLGSDYVFPKTVNKLIKALLQDKEGELIGEEYLPLGHQDFQEVIDQIKEKKPDAVLSTINGDSNISFYQQYERAGLTPTQIPIMALSVTETELQMIGVASTGHYASWSYFQSLDTPVNEKFVAHWQARYGAERVISDPMATAYTLVYLWKEAVELAGSLDVNIVRQSAIGLSCDSPMGLVTIAENQHLCKPTRLGKILANGQFASINTNTEKIKPLPWLGIEELGGQIQPIITSLLKEVPLAELYNSELAEKNRQLQNTLNELQIANQQLRLTEFQLVTSESHIRELSKREELIKRQLSSQIHNSLNLDEILNTAVQEIRSLLDLDCCKFLWYFNDVDPPRFDLVVKALAPHITADNANMDSQSDQENWQAIHQLEMAIQEMNFLTKDQSSYQTEIDRITQDYLNSLEENSLLNIPVTTHIGKTGVIICEKFVKNHEWSQGEIELLFDIATQLAIAIDQAKLYENSRNNERMANSQAEQLKQTLYHLQQAQGQLIQNEKMSALGQLISGIAYEISNPINFIYGNISHAQLYFDDLIELVELYQKYCLPVPAEITEALERIEIDFLIKDLPQILKSIQGGAERIRNIVLSLKNFSRPDSGEAKVIDIHQGINSVIMIVQHRLHGNINHPPIELVREYGDLPAVECYAGDLNQVFMNIISNAIDAIYANQVGKSLMETTKNPGQIRIKTAVTEQHSVLIQIADNGPGMILSVKERVFEPFFTTKSGGTGLGLSISHQVIVEKHRGAIWCQSTPGKGSEFFLEIPIKFLHVA